jgi:hypothetical protein
MNAATMNTLAQEVLTSCTLDDGKLVLNQATFLSLGQRIHGSDDKKGWGTTLVALATRLKTVPGASHAAERVTALAAIALGDVELNGMLCRELYGARGAPAGSH